MVFIGGFFSGMGIDLYIDFKYVLQEVCQFVLVFFFFELRFIVESGVLYKFLFFWLMFFD